MLYVEEVTVPKQESVFLVTTEIAVHPVVLGLDSVWEDFLMTQTHVEMSLQTDPIMEKDALLRWVTYWSNKAKFIVYL